MIEMNLLMVETSPGMNLVMNLEMNKMSHLMTAKNL